MPLEDNNEEVAVDGQEENLLGGMQTSGFSSSKDAVNPYTTQLTELLGKYLKQSEKSATDKQALLDKARERVMARSAGPDSAEMAFRLAAALGKPTKTGGFGETLANVAETTGEALSQRRKSRQELEDLNLKYQLAASDVEGDKYKTQVGALSTLARSAPKTRLTEIERLQEVIDNSGSSEASKKNAQARITYLTTRATPAAKTNEIDQLLVKLNDPSVSPANKKVYQQRLNKLNYIPAEAKADKDAGKPLSPAGKVASDEGLVSGTPEYIARVKQLVGEGKGANLSPREQTELFEAEDIVNASTTVILNLEKALKLNPKAYEGFAAGTRRSIVRNIPGAGKSEGVTATTELESLIGQNQLDQMKVIFGGNPTEGERKILLELGGSINQSEKEREAIYTRAITAAARRLKSSKEKMERIRSGSYSGKAAPEANAKGGPVGRYADGGVVHMADGGEMSMANIGRAVGQGLGLGFGDEAIARVRAKMENRPYEDVVREEREAYQRFQEKNPFTALGTELVSGLIPTVGMAMIPGAGTPGAVAGGTRMAMAANKLSQYLPKFMTGTMGKAAGTAAATGAIAGAGSETEGNRMSGAVTGGTTGAVLGPTVAKGIQLGGQGIKAAKNAILPSKGAADQRAANKVLEAMGRDEMDPTALRAKMLADQKLGVQSTIMDATPSLSTLGEAVVTRPGKGRKILGDGLNERLEGGRESAAARALKDVGKGVDYTAQEDKLIGTLRSNANNLYDRAYAHGAVDDPRILKVLEDDTFKKAFKEAQAIANKEARAAELRGEDPSRFKLKDLYELDPADNTFKFTGTQLPDVRTLDYVKRGIDALIDKGYRGEGMSKAEANALKDLKKAYVKAIDDNVPEYAAARAKYAGDIEVLDALRLGRADYLSPKTLPAEAKKLVDGMSEAERDALRAGVAQSLLTKVLEAPQQINAAQRIIGAPATRKRLEALFQDPNEYKVFEAALKRESELFRNAQDIVRGSRTANKTEALKDLKAGNAIFDIAGEAMDIATGSPGSVVGRVLKYLQARTSLDEKTAGEVAEMLKSGTQQEIDATLQKLESSSAKFLKDSSRSAQRLKMTSGAVGAAAPTTSLPAPESADPAEESDEEKLQRLLKKYSVEE